MTCPETGQAEAAFQRRRQLVMQAVERHHAYLLAHVRSIVGHHDGEDVIQDLFKYALIHLPEHLICSLPVLRRKARFLALDVRRRRSLRQADSLDHESTPEPAAPETAESADADDNDEALACRFWEEFPVSLGEEQKRVIWMHGRHGLTFEEIERELGVPSSTAHEWVIRGRRLILALLENE